MHVLAFAVLAALCPVVLPVTVVEERGHVLVGDYIDVAAVAAVAAVRPSARDVLLPPEADAPIAARAGFHVNLCLVYEFDHGDNILHRPGAIPRSLRFS